MERKERTRRAILDAALDLSSTTGLAALSLRQVAKEVGIVPTAFYRHFASIDELGLALVDESFVSLRALLREVRSGGAGRAGEMVDHSVAVLVEHVHAHRAHFSFIARERVAGPAQVRAAIRHEIDLCERELATDLARLPVLAAWPGEDLHVLAGLIVTLMVAAAEDLVAALRPEQERQLVANVRARLRMVVVGAAGWRPSPA